MTVHIIRVGHLAAAGELGHKGGVSCVPPGVDEVSGALTQPLPLPGGQGPHVMIMTECHYHDMRTLTLTKVTGFLP